MDKYNFYFEQLVSESQMDQAFSWVESAIWQTRLTALLARTAGVPHGAIHVGAGVTQNASADLNVLVAAGQCTDPQGKHVEWDTQQTIDCSVDYLGASTSVGSGGNERYLGIFALWDQSQTESVIDGNGLSVYSKILDSFEIQVHKGTEASAGTAVPPATPANSIRLANVKLAYGTVAILNADIFYDIAGYLRDDYVRVTGVNLSDFVFGNPSDALEQLFATIDAMSVSGGIGFTASGAWHDTTALVSSNVQDAINEVVADLSAAAGPECGSDKVGSKAHTTTYGNADLTQGSAYDQLTEIADTVDSFISGANKWSIPLSNWEKLLNDSAGTEDLKGVMYHPSTGKWILVGANKVYRSNDALELSATAVHTLAANFEYCGIDIDLTRYLVANSNGDIEHCTDPDGTWSSETSATIGGSGSIRAIKTKYPSSNFTLLARGVSIRIGALGIGGGWVAPTTPPSNTYPTQALVYMGGTTWILLTSQSNNAHTYISTDDGDTWASTTTDPDSVDSGDKYHIDYNPNSGALIVVGLDSSSDPHIVRSTNSGGSWSAATINYPPNVEASMMALNFVYYINGSTWIAGGSTSGTYYNLLVSHDDGLTWDYVAVQRQSTSETVENIYRSRTDGYRAVCCGDSGRSIRSLSHII